MSDPDLRQALRFLLAQWHAEAQYDPEISTQRGLPYFTAIERRRVYHVCAEQLQELLTLQGSAPQP